MSPHFIDVAAGRVYIAAVPEAGEGPGLLLFLDGRGLRLAAKPYPTRAIVHDWQIEKQPHGS
jgi:hypothetical protein